MKVNEKLKRDDFISLDYNRINEEVRENMEFASLSNDINATVAALKRYIEEAATRLWCRTHLGDGPGTAAPGVQHDCILVPFLQHFILKSKTRSAGRKHSRATRLLNSSPCLHILGFTVWSLDQQHQRCLVGLLIRNAESQALPWAFGI